MLRPTLDRPHVESNFGNRSIARFRYGASYRRLHPIPSAANKEDQRMLSIYKPLLLPQPEAAMPAHRDIEVVLEALSQEFPWASNVMNELGSMLRARSLFGVRELCLAPVLIVGFPGSGKSRFVRRLAEHLKLPYLPLALGGRKDSKLPTGTTRGWAGGEPTPLLRLILQHKSASGLVLLDEIDKVGVTDSTSTPATSVLLGLLEPETAARCMTPSCKQPATSRD